MALTKQKKVSMLGDLSEKVKGAKIIIFARNNGLKLDEMSELRSQIKEQGNDFQVAKKTLLKIALADNKFPQVSDEILDGPIAIAISHMDEMAPTKTMANFMKKHEALEFMGGIYEGEVIDAAYLKALAAVPSKPELLAKFMGSAMSPVQGFVGVLNNTMSGFVRALNAIAQKA